ncbi:ComEC/Rec2 family competence protein [Novispirillum sp. DQ9]|uniref:ComEC/Rec2 family competence protein n=1 Tax=Novispirillum sp. DQ9 TaxID=3398612 RepID=UPI003C7EA19B
MQGVVDRLPRPARRLAVRLAGVPGRFRALAEAERDRWSPWLAVCFGTGAAACLGLPGPLPVWVGIGATATLAAAAVWTWRRGWMVALLLVGLAVVAAGFAVAQGRMALVAAPTLARELGPVSVEGRVEAVEPHGKGWRLLLAEPVVERLPTAATPSRLRISIHGAEPPHGARVRLRARLLPPPGPAAPGAYDFARQAWFSGIGGVGFALSAVEVVAAPAGMGEGWLGELRGEVTRRLRDGVEGAAGGVAAALVTGQRGAVPGDVIDAYRDSGLAHLLAISGLHMGLAAGIMFVGLRAVIALVPPLALRINGKKVAAVSALAGAAAYLALSGANVPAQRAFVMTAVVLGAVLIDRSALTFRVLAAAAVVVLLWRPEAVVGPSFQLSFAAVAALVAAYEVLGPRLSRWRADGEGWLGPMWRGAAVYLLGILASTVVSTLATAPFSAAHFGAIPAFGPAANLAAIPLVGLWVMPGLVAALLLMPLGLDGLVYPLLRPGLQAIEGIAVLVAGWPGAVLAVPPVPTWAVAVAAIAGLWLCLWRRPWRLAAVPVLLVLLAVPWLGTPPDVLVSEDGALLAVRSGPGLVLSPGRGDGFARDVWRELYGEGSGMWDDRGLRDGAADVSLACDARGCLYRGPGGQLVALIRHEAALVEDCRLADVAVLLFPASRRACAAPQVVTFWDLRERGAHALTLIPEGVRIATVEGERGRWPWSRPQGQRPPQSGGVD